MKLMLYVCLKICGTICCQMPNLNEPMDGEVCPGPDNPVREDLLRRSELPEDAVPPLSLESAVRLGKAQGVLPRFDAVIVRLYGCS